MSDLTRHVHDLHDDVADILFSRMVLPPADEEIGRMLAAVQQAIARRMLEAREDLLTGVRREVRILLDAERRRFLRMTEPSAS